MNRDEDDEEGGRGGGVKREGSSTIGAV